MSGRGGTPPMMGQLPRMQSLFYYFRLEDQIPEDHLLRLIDRYVDLSFVRDRLKNLYSSTGRPSIDPEVLLRLLLVGYLYGITSERRLLEEVRMHLAYRWFTRLGFEQEIPDHSTFSKNRHGRFRQSGVFREVFEEIVRRCLEAGLVEGQNLAVDGTIVAADASRQSRVPREQLQEAAQLSRTVREYLAELEHVNPVSDAEMISITACGGITDLVEDGVNGFLVPPRDPDRLAETLNRLLRDETLRAKLGRHGQEIVRHKFSFEVFRAELEKILAERGLDSSRAA
jgi:transposase